MSFRRWVRERLDQPVNLDAAAQALATSKPALSRRFGDVSGKTPIEYLRDLLGERAVHLLRTTDTSVDRIAEMVGYSDGATLRTLLPKRLRSGVKALRG